MKKILITYATRPLGIRVVNALTEKYDLIQSTSDEVPSVFANKYISIPKGVNPTFAHELLKIAIDKGVNYILPLGLEEVRTLSTSLVLFEEYEIKVLCPSLAELEDIHIIPNPGKDLELTLAIDGINVFTDQNVLGSFPGLGVVSDSGEDFMLCVIK